MELIPIAALTRSGKDHALNIVPYPSGLSRFWTYRARLWGPEPLRTLRDVLIFVDQFAEPVASSDIVDRVWVRRGWGRRGAAWPSARCGRTDAPRRRRAAG